MGRPALPRAGRSLPCIAAWPSPKQTQREPPRDIRFPVYPVGSRWDLLPAPTANNFDCGSLRDSLPLPGATDTAARHLSQQRKSNATRLIGSECDGHTRCKKNDGAQMPVRRLPQAASTARSSPYRTYRAKDLYYHIQAAAPEEQELPVAASAAWYCSRCPGRHALVALLYQPPAPCAPVH